MNENILITGGTGSLGQALVTECLKHDFRTIRIYSRNEYLQWLMRQEPQFQDDRLRWMIGDVRDRERLQQCLQGIEYIIHTAALKHLPVGQYNPQEFIKTNILGSINIVDIAIQCQAEKVLGISSDKAVMPCSLYGATKQTMEFLFLDANRRSMPVTCFSLYRPANFTESHGNILELWDKQAKTGICTLTDEGMYRYFIDTQQAAKIALECLENMQGGEIFVPKGMTESSMLEILKGRHPETTVKLIGNRDAERLHESLFADSEMNRIEEHEHYYVVR